VVLLIDPKVIREDFPKIKANLEKRKNPEVVGRLEKWFSQDKDWRSLKAKSDDLRGKRNTITEEIKQAKGKGADIKSLLDKAKTLPDEIKRLMRR